MLTAIPTSAEGTGAADTVTGKSVSNCQRMTYLLRTYYCISATMSRRIEIASFGFQGVVSWK